MSSAKEIKQAMDRVQGIFAARPEKGRIAKSGRAVLSAGLLCEYTEEGKTIAADMPETFGGGGKLLSPGGYMRAGLATCLAIGYAMRAAHRGVPLRRVEVEIQGEADFGSLFGLPGCAVGYKGMRYAVRIESEAPEPEIVAIVDEGDARSPVLAAMREAQNITRTVQVTRPETV